MKLIVIGVFAISGCYVGLMIGYGKIFEPVHFKNYFTLFTLNIFLFLFAIFMGLVKRLSSSEESYLNRRNGILKFGIKWGIIYYLFTLLLRFIFFYI